MHVLWEEPLIPTKATWFLQEAPPCLPPHPPPPFHKVILAVQVTPVTAISHSGEAHSPRSMILSAAETTQEGCAGALSGEDVVLAPFKLERSHPLLCPSHPRSSPFSGLTQGLGLGGFLGPKGVRGTRR